MDSSLNKKLLLVKNCLNVVWFKFVYQFHFRIIFLFQIESPRIHTYIDDSQKLPLTV